MQAFAARSGGALTLITSAPELDAYIARRQLCLRSGGGGCNFTAGLLGVEGAHALDHPSHAENPTSGVSELYNAGVRLFGLHHFADNAAGGSVHGLERGGLTPWGRELITQIENHGMVLDLAHSSAAVLAEALQMVRRPFLVSHTGVAALCRGPGDRTLSDSEIVAIAEKGGVIGIGFWDEVTCSRGVDGIVASMHYVAALVGAKHVNIGSDWDGGTSVPAGLDAAGVAQVTAGLMAKGWGGEELEGMMGRNGLRVLREALVPWAEVVAEEEGAEAGGWEGEVEE